MPAHQAAPRHRSNRPANQPAIPGAADSCCAAVWPPAGPSPLLPAMARPCSRASAACVTAAPACRPAVPPAATRSNPSSASTPPPAISTPTPARSSAPRPAWAAGRSAACGCGSTARTTGSCGWPATPITRWPPPARRRWRCRYARSTPGSGATAGSKAGPPPARAARPCWSIRRLRIGCCIRSSGSVRAAAASGSAFPSSNWSRKSAKAATCSVKVMSMACAPSATRRHRSIRPIRNSARAPTS